MYAIALIGEWWNYCIDRGAQEGFISIFDLIHNPDKTRPYDVLALIGDGAVLAFHGGPGTVLCPYEVRLTEPKYSGWLQL